MNEWYIYIWYPTFKHTSFIIWKKGWPDIFSEILIHTEVYLGCNEAYDWSGQFHPLCQTGKDTRLEMAWLQPHTNVSSYLYCSLLTLSTNDNGVLLLNYLCFLILCKEKFGKLLFFFFQSIYRLFTTHIYYNWDGVGEINLLCAMKISGDMWNAHQNLIIISSLHHLI